MESYPHQDVEHAIQTRPVTSTDTLDETGTPHTQHMEDPRYKGSTIRKASASYYGIVVSSSSCFLLHLVFSIMFPNIERKAISFGSSFWELEISYNSVFFLRHIFPCAPEMGLKRPKWINFLHVEPCTSTKSTPKYYIFCLKRAIINENCYLKSNNI